MLSLRPWLVTQAGIFDLATRGSTPGMDRPDFNRFAHSVSSNCGFSGIFLVPTHWDTNITACVVLAAVAMLAVLILERWGKIEVAATDGD